MIIAKEYSSHQYLLTFSFDWSIVNLLKTELPKNSRRYSKEAGGWIVHKTVRDKLEELFGNKIAFEDKPKKKRLKTKYKSKIPEKTDEIVCPFCKRSDSLLEEPFDLLIEKPKYAIICTHCEAQGPTARTPEKAKELWENR